MATRGTARHAIALFTALAAAMVLFALAPLALPQSYSPVALGTSEAAAQGVAGAWVARLGFVMFGLAVLGICVLRHQSWPPLTTGLHGGFGVGMILVAVFSHAPWETGVPYVELEDQLHSVFASVVGFSFIAGVASTMFTRRPRTRMGVVGDIAALLVATTVPLLAGSSLWGAAQRLMFITAAAWYAAEVQRQRAIDRAATVPRP